MQTILIFAFDGIMDSSLAISLDLLNTALRVCSSSTRKNIQIFTVGFRKTIVTAAGLRMSCDLTFKTLESADLKPQWIIIPGAGMDTEKALHTRLQDKDMRAVQKGLRHFHHNSKQARPAACKIAASCSSVFLLAEAGITEGHRVTTTWWLAPHFRERYPHIHLNENKMLLRDRQLLTAGAAYAQLDLMLALVSELMGEACANTCASYLLLDQGRTQARYIVPGQLRQNDASLVAIEKWIDSAIEHPFTVDELASTFAMSSKTLGRKIYAASQRSTLKFIQNRRLIRALQLIDNSPLSIEAIAEKVGYQDGTALRKLIKRELGITPTALRRRD